jgi:small subunit ribosomal protein S14
MAKKSRIERNNKIELLVQKNAKKRELIKKNLKCIPSEDSKDYVKMCQIAFRAMLDIQKLPRDTSKTRFRRRCKITGRPRGITSLGIERNQFRQMAHKGDLPGIQKASW